MSRAEPDAFQMVWWLWATVDGNTAADCEVTEQSRAGSGGAAEVGPRFCRSNDPRIRIRQPA